MAAGGSAVLCEHCVLSAPGMLKLQSRDSQHRLHAVYQRHCLLCSGCSARLSRAFLLKCLVRLSLKRGHEAKHHRIPTCSGGRAGYS